MMMAAGYSETLDVRYMTPSYPSSRQARSGSSRDSLLTSDVTLSASHQLPLQCGAAMQHQQQQRRTVPRRSSSYRSSGDDDDDDDDEEEEEEDGGDRYPGCYDHDGGGGVHPSRDCRGGGRGRYARGYAQRSEWVTLSKTILMQLVERICQLSFQGDMQPFGSSSSSSSTVSDYESASSQRQEYYRDRVEQAGGWSVPPFFSDTCRTTLRPSPSPHQQCTGRTECEPTTAATAVSSGVVCDILAQTTPQPPPALTPTVPQSLSTPSIVPPPRASRKNRIVRPWSEDEDLPVTVSFSAEQQQQQQPLFALPLLPAVMSSQNSTLSLLPVTTQNALQPAMTSQNSTLPLLLSVTSQDTLLPAMTSLLPVTSLPPSSSSEGEGHSQVATGSLTFASRTCALEIDKRTSSSPPSGTTTMEDDDDVFKSSSVKTSHQQPQQLQLQLLPCDVDKENVMTAGSRLTASHTQHNLDSFSFVASSEAANNRVVQNEKNSLVDLLSDINTAHAATQNEGLNTLRDVTKSNDVERTSQDVVGMIGRRTRKTAEGLGQNEVKHSTRKSKKCTNDNVPSYPDVEGYQCTTAAVGGRGGRKRRAAQGAVGGDTGGMDEGRLSSGIQLYLVNKRLCDENTTRRENRSSTDPQHSSRQSWVALNKSLVYGMIDSALASAHSDVKRKQRHHKERLHRERLLTSSRDARESKHVNRVKLTTQGSGKRTGDCATRAERFDLNNVRNTDTRVCVDMNFNKSICSPAVLDPVVVAVSPASRLSDINTKNVTRKKNLDSDDVPFSPLAITQKKSNKVRTRKTFIESQETEKLFGRNNNNNNNYNIGGYDTTHPRGGDCEEKDICKQREDSNYAGREDFVLRSNHSSDDIDVGTNEDVDHEVENEPLLRGIRSRGVQRAYKRSSGVTLQGCGGDVRRTLGGSNEGVSPTPRWIALDKSQVCSLVESLVSTMMMLDDSTHLPPTQSSAFPAITLGVESVFEFQSKDDVGTKQQTTNTSASSDSLINHLASNNRESPPSHPPSEGGTSGQMSSDDRDNRESPPTHLPSEGGTSGQMSSDDSIDDCQLLVPRSKREDEPIEGQTRGVEAASDHPSDLVGGGLWVADESTVVLEGCEKLSSSAAAVQSRRQAIKWKSSMLLRMRSSEHVLKLTTTSTSSQSH